MDTLGPVLIREGFWWVGDKANASQLQCNPYLLIEGDSAILFDPGSVLDAPIVLKNVQMIVPLENLEAIVLSHENPDLCSAVPYFEENGFKGILCCHEHVAWIIRYYGITSEFYLVNMNKFHYQMKNGSNINFLSAPYLPSAGTMMTYLPKQKILVSGNLFCALPKTWNLYAQGDYENLMKTYHESYMPSHEILASVMNQLLNYEITMICPQHGSIINKNVIKFIEILRDLPCGIFLDSVQKKIITDEGIVNLCNEILKRYFALFGNKEIHEVFSNSDFVIDYKKKIIKKVKIPYEKIWEEIFLLIAEKKGMSWITIISPLVENLCKQYDMKLPMVFESIIFNAQKDSQQMSEQYQNLENLKLQLEINLKKMEEQVVRCPITGLYNQEFFEYFIIQEIESFTKNGNQFSILLLSIDNLSDINLDYGSDEGNVTMKNLTYNLRQSSGSTSSQNFRLEGGVFAVFYQGINREQSIKYSNELRNTIFESDHFITKVTASMGLFHSSELPKNRMLSNEEIRQISLQTARFRLKIAKRSGRNTLVSDSAQQLNAKATYTILLVDEPGLQRDIIQKAIEKERYNVIVASDGLQARDLVEQENPDVIVSELFVQKLSAFTLRKELLTSPGRRKTPFVVMSSNKTEVTVEHAIGLGITYFFSRPVLLCELLGVIDTLTTRLQSAEGFSR